MTTYTEVQQAVKVYKLKGLTDIKLNSSRTDLESELLRLQSSTTVTSDGVEKFSQAEKQVEADNSIFPFDPLEFALELCDGHVTEGVEKFSQVAKTPTETAEPTDTEEVSPVVKPIAWIDGEAVYQSSDKDSTEAIEVCNFCRGTGVYGGSPCFHCNSSGFTEEDSESDYRASVEDILFELEEKVELFLSAVRQGFFLKDQLNAIAVALAVGNERDITVAEALTQTGSFHLFPPSNLLAWGFDQIAPSLKFISDFRAAVASVYSRQANVNVKFNPGNENATLLAAWAASWCGSNWCSGMGPDYQDEDWSFPSLEYAEQFREYCQKLDFVQSATIDRIVSNEEIPQQKLAELEMVS